MPGIDYQTSGRKYTLPGVVGDNRTVAPPDVQNDPIYPAPSAQDYYHTIRPRRIVLDLSTARDRVSFQVAGTAVVLEDTTNTTDRVEVYFGESSDPVRLGGKVNRVIGVPFNYISFSNQAIAGATATLSVWNPQPSQNVSFV